MTKTIYWIDGFTDGQAVGGAFIFARSLPQFLEEIKESKLNPVGLEFDSEDHKLVNVILERNEEYIKRYETKER